MSKSSKVDLPAEANSLLDDHRFRSHRDSAPDPADLVVLPHERLAFVYPRLSTHEQVRKSVFSIQMQEALADMAREEGYPEELVYVERRDLGISGTLGREQREGLAYLIELIEQDRVEAIFVIHISRLFRDQTLIDGLAFGELCKKHNVIIVMPSMRLNLRDKMHMRLYRMELERSADELDLLRSRLLGARDFKGRQGLYAGGSIAPGYVLNVNSNSEGYGKITPYEPHARIVRTIFEQFVGSGGHRAAVVQYCRRHELFFPPFPDEILAFMKGKHSFLNSRLTSRGYPITPGMVAGILSNPAYIGWGVYAGEVVNMANHPAIIEPDLFWQAQSLRAGPKPRGVAATRLPHPLQALVYCDNHDGELLLVSPSRRGKASQRLYACERAQYNQLSETSCLNTSAYVLEEPIISFVISRFQLAHYAEPVLQHLEAELGETRTRAESYRRDVARLNAQIERLREDLEVIETPFQRKAVWQEIEAKTQQREALSRVENHPVGRLLTAADVDNVRSCLSELPQHWESFPDHVKNEFMRLVLDRITLKHDRHVIIAQIEWKTGRRDRLRIYRPRQNGSRHWTDEEESLLREHFPKSSREHLLELLPERKWYGILHHALAMGLERDAVWSRKAKRKFPAAGTPWTPEEDEMVRRYYAAETSYATVTANIARSRSCIQRRAQALGLKWVPRNLKRQSFRWEVISEDEENAQEPETPFLAQEWGATTGNEFGPKSDSRPLRPRLRGDRR